MNQEVDKAKLQEAFENLTDWLLDNIPDDGVWEDEPLIDGARNLVWEVLEDIS